MSSVFASNVAAPRNFFFTGLIAALIVAVLAGFGPSYSARIGAGAPIPALVHVHAAFFLTWLLLMLVQTLLVHGQRIDWHRRLGITMSLLAVPMMWLGLATAIGAARHPMPDRFGPGRPFPDPFAFLIVPLGDLLLFAAFLVTALLLRRRRDAHRRLMVLAAIGGLAWPAITRIPAVAGKFPLMFGLLVLFTLALPMHDLWTRRRVHPASLIGALLILASMPLRRAISSTDAWHRFAAWLTA